MSGPSKFSEGSGHCACAQGSFGGSFGLAAGPKCTKCSYDLAYHSIGTQGTGITPLRSADPSPSTTQIVEGQAALRREPRIGYAPCVYFSPLLLQPFSNTYPPVSASQLTAYHDLYSRIRGAELTLDLCSAPGEETKIPFPFWGNQCPVRFHLREGCFTYMGREIFTDLYNSIQSFERALDFRKIYLSGTSGYGKSYLLAALACLLIKEDKRVVYLPDCRAMLEDFGGYLTSSLLLCFANSGARQLEVKACGEDVQRLIGFCKRLANYGESLTLIVDQYDALDWEEPGVGEIANEHKEKIDLWIRNIAYHHAIVKGASASYKAAAHMKEKQVKDIKIGVYGGYTKVSDSHLRWASVNPLTHGPERDGFVVDDTRGDFANDPY